MQLKGVSGPKMWFNRLIATTKLKMTLSAYSFKWIRDGECTWLDYEIRNSNLFALNTYCT